MPRFDIIYPEYVEVGPYEIADKDKSAHDYCSIIKANLLNDPLYQGFTLEYMIHYDENKGYVLEKECHGGVKHYMILFKTIRFHHHSPLVPDRIIRDGTIVSYENG